MLSYTTKDIQIYSRLIAIAMCNIVAYSKVRLRVLFCGHPLLVLDCTQIADARLRRIKCSQCSRPPYDVFFCVSSLISLYVTVFPEFEEQTDTPAAPY